MDPSKVIWVDMETSSQEPSLFAGKVDAIPSYHTRNPSVDKQAKKLGKAIGRFNYSDLGVDIYFRGKVGMRRGDGNHSCGRRFGAGMTLDGLSPDGETFTKPDGGVRDEHLCSIHRARRLFPRFCGDCPARPSQSDRRTWPHGVIQPGRLNGAGIISLGRKLAEGSDCA